MRTLFLDPGIRCLGISEFGDQLCRAALIRNPVKKGNTVSEVSEIVSATLDWLGDGVWDSIHVEVPQIYGNANKEKDPNDLIPLALIGGGVVCKLGARVARPRQYKPVEWKGSMEADAMTRMIESRLSSLELSRIEPCPPSLRHNVLDAVGMGLFATGRLQPARVYPF